MKLAVALLLLAALPLTACSSSHRKEAVTVQAPTVAAHHQPVYFVGGRVKGLEGIGLAVTNSQGQDIDVEDDGKFVFSRTVTDGSEFAVSIVRQPISPIQTCVIEHASGKIAGKNAMETQVVCSTISLDGPTTTTSADAKHASR